MDTFAGSGSVLEADARRLMVDYAYAIDDGRLSEWPTFFTDPCLYRITTRQNEEQGMPLSIMLCDSQAMLYDRVEAVEKANVFEPHYYRHILSDSRRLPAAGDGLRLETSFICVRTMLDGRQGLFAAGVYRDHVVSDGGRCRFRSRAVILDSSQVDTLLAIPL